jgi:hypothetical protein
VRVYIHTQVTGGAVQADRGLHHIHHGHGRLFL